MKIHDNFKLNGRSYNYADLKYVAYSLIKEGDSYEYEIGNFLMDWLSKEPTVEVMTSGSTGSPKKIYLKKEHMVNSAKATGKFLNLLPGDTALNCLSSEFIAGKMMVLRAMVLGLNLTYIEPTSNPLLHDPKNYDFCAMVPLQLANSLEKIDQIGKLIVGGAPISSVLKQQLSGKECKVYESYGMTETCTHIALKEINTSITAENYFKTLPGVKIIKDKRNCLVIDAPKITTDPVSTNDIVEIHSDTEFEWQGRYDNIINSGGIKLVPEQIEAKLSSIIDSRFFITGKPDPILGQKLVLIIEGKERKKNLLEDIKSISTLNTFEIPKEIIYMDAFLETENGKILREKITDLKS